MEYKGLCCGTILTLVQFSIFPWYYTHYHVNKKNSKAKTGTQQLHCRLTRSYDKYTLFFSFFPHLPSSALRFAEEWTVFFRTTESKKFH